MDSFILSVDVDIEIDIDVEKQLNRSTTGSFSLKWSLHDLENNVIAQ